MNKNTIDFENMENISNEFICEYNKIIESEIPPLWDKIEKGYNKEFASMKKGEGLNDSDGIEKHHEDKIIDIKSKKNKRNFKIITSVAAILLVFLISAPFFLARTIKKSFNVQTIDSDKWVGFTYEEAEMAKDGIEESEMAEENMEEMAEADMEESVEISAETIIPQESETIHETTIQEGVATSYDMVNILFNIGYEIKINNN